MRINQNTHPMTKNDFSTYIVPRDIVELNDRYVTTAYICMLRFATYRNEINLSARECSLYINHNHKVDPAVRDREEQCYLKAFMTLAQEGYIRASANDIRNLTTTETFYATFHPGGGWIKQCQRGDGRIPQGIINSMNITCEEWPVEFTGTYPELIHILAYLTSRDSDEIVYRPVNKYIRYNLGISILYYEEAAKHLGYTPEYFLFALRSLGFSHMLKYRYIRFEKSTGESKSLLIALPYSHKNGEIIRELVSQIKNDHKANGWVTTKTSKESPELAKMARRMA